VTETPEEAAERNFASLGNPVAQVHGCTHDDQRWNQIYVWCPGCDSLHGLPVDGDSTKRPTWSWNGSLTDVTLDPSILTRYTRPDGDFVCHSFLRAGVWQFLGDCTHKLKGMNVPMVPLPDWVLRAWRA
jgi:hypothetical protein